MLQVERDRPPAAAEGGGERFEAARGGTVDPQHIGPEVGEKHGPERHGRQPRELDDPQVAQWSLPFATHGGDHE